MRVLDSAPITSEKACFPAAEQAARIIRRSGKRKTETVYSISSRTLAQLDAKDYLNFTRVYWSIENGLHQRLDVTAGEDKSRVRTPKSVLILGMFRRVTISLFAAWALNLGKFDKYTLTDFYTYMQIKDRTAAFCVINSKKPFNKTKRKPKACV